MSTFLFDRVVFGPILSRRLGSSLGINLLPIASKLCNFNCIYCECGWNNSYRATKATLPTKLEVEVYLEKSLERLYYQDRKINVITFAGNGEPTLHPNFGEIVDIATALRDKYYPSAKIAVLSNGTRLKDPKVANALRKIDQCILKLDAANEKLFKLINQPVLKVELNDIMKSLSKFEGELIIQTLFFKGEFKGNDVTNLNNEHIHEWIKKIKQIKPHAVMIYTLDRDTPTDGLIRASSEELKQVAQQVERIGVKVEAFS